MLILKMLIAASSILIFAGSVFGALTADEANKLGTTLTEVGAEKAGNADGSIPAYIGGLTTTPPTFKKGSNIRPNPFANEKPLYIIDAKNVDKYGEKLTKGTQALIKKYPGYQVEVYKTHRSAAFPKDVLEGTLKAARTASTKNNGISLEGAHEGYPFPIPKTGIEAMWNHQVSYSGTAFFLNMKGMYTNSAGRTTMVNQSDNYMEYQYWQKGDNSGNYYLGKTVMTGPPRRAGEAIIAIDPVNIFDKGRSAYQYLPGQRRVKLAPEIGYDTPDFNISGATVFDDVYIYNGGMDRYDYKLIGKKEIYVPYNCYKVVYESTTDKLFGPKYLNPEYVRWELHRVWVVEATLKAGKRHLYKKRTFYLDEDTWRAVASESYDGHDQLYRVGFAYMTPAYDVLVPWAVTHGIYDLVAKTYTLNFWPAETGGVKFLKSFPAKERSPESLAGSGVR